MNILGTPVWSDTLCCEHQSVPVFVDMLENEIKNYLKIKKTDYEASAFTSNISSNATWMVNITAKGEVMNSLSCLT